MRQKFGRSLTGHGPAFSKVCPAARGWVPATSGNFSLRAGRDACLVTRSGLDKGNLGPDDLIAVPLEGALPPGISAEAPLHVERYRSDPSIGAILHIHSIAATVPSGRWSMAV